MLHLLPVDLARGAQTYARMLCDALDRPGERHRTLTLFASEPAALHPDDSLGVPDGRVRALGFDPRAGLKLRRWLRRTRPAVVVAHGGEPAVYGAFARPGDVRLVYYRIGVDDRIRRPLSRAKYRWAARRCDIVAGVSTETLDHAADVLGVARARLRLIPNGRDPAPFAPRSPTTAPGTPPLVVWVGHLNHEKRPEWFVRAIAALREQGVELQARIVGDGPLASDLAAPATAAGVEMLGRRDDVPDILRGSDIVCMTGAGPEGLPGVLIEAALSGRPALSSRVAGAATVIDDGVTGVLVDIDDFDGFVHALRALIDDPDRAARMGAAARTRGLEQFTLDASVAKWRTLLDELSAL